jgi:hypothetical protein
MRGLLMAPLLCLLLSCGDDTSNVDMGAGACTVGSTCANGQACCAGCPGMQPYCGPCLGLSCQANDSCTLAGGSCNDCGPCAPGFHATTNDSLYACPQTSGPGCVLTCCFPDRDGGL